MGRGRVEDRFDLQYAIHFNVSLHNWVDNRAFQVSSIVRFPSCQDVVFLTFCQAPDWANASVGRHLAIFRVGSPLPPTDGRFGVVPAIVSLPPQTLAGIIAHSSALPSRHGVPSTDPSTRAGRDF